MVEKINLKISHRLIIGFSIIFLGFIINGILTMQLVNQNKKLNEEYQNIYAPSAKYLDDLYKVFSESRFLIKNWVWVEKKSIDETTDKLSLQKLIDEEYPFLISELEPLVVYWDEESQNLYQQATEQAELLFEQHKYIMYELLDDFWKYDEPIFSFEAQLLVDPDAGEIMIMTNEIMQNLSIVLDKQNEIVKKSNAKLIESFNWLGNFIIILTLIIGVFVIIIATLTTRSIVKPMKFIKNILLEIAKGKLPTIVLPESKDEIGQMAKALNTLIASFKTTSEFAQNVGNGNFKHQFVPLSEDDILGNSLIAMRNQLREQIEQLKENEELLEQKVKQRTEEVVKQKEVIEQKNKDITASINYAQRIQKAMLPQIRRIKEKFEDAFIFFKPRDIVSGDFYWYSDVNKNVIVAAIDCTGHGVPGAFMSLIGEAYISQIVEKQNITEPNIILNELHRYVRKALKQDEIENHDGMDMALCSVDFQNKKLFFAGAKNPLVYIQNSELNIIKGDKHPIGGLQWEKDKERAFTKHTIDISEKTVFYIYSDGYGDQFGGQKKRKFMASKLNKILFEIYDKSCDEQEQILEDTFFSWKGINNQIDDVLIICCKI